MFCQRISFVLRVPQLIHLRSIGSNFAISHIDNNGQTSLPKQRYDACWSNIMMTLPGNGLSVLGRRAYCSVEQPPPPAIIPVVLYDEIKDLPNHPEKLLVDVREPNEILETGRIPTSINIPLGDVKLALSDDTPPAVFSRRYGVDKPTESQQLIFMCKIGRRSETAATFANQLGYTKVKNYKGSWLDWAEREGLPQ